MNFFKNILNKVKLIFNQNDKLIKIDDLLNQVEIGDIIWAKRYKTKEEKLLIPEGHREGPFIVIYKCRNGLVCCKGTGTYYDKYILRYFELDNQIYNLKKTTFFRLCDLLIIDNKTFIKKIDKLIDKDMKSLLKQLKINHGNYYNIDGENHKISIPLEIGDIINNKNINYLIIDVIDSKFLCIPINKKINDLKYNLTFDDFRNLDYSKIVSIGNNENIKYINTASNNSLLFVLKKQKEYIEYLKNQKITQRGSVISKDNKYYYVYGEEGNNWLVFEISKVKKQNFDVVTINNEQFYTNYKVENIDKKEIFHTLFLATSYEIDLIKNKKKSYRKTLKNNKIYNVGDIVYVNNYPVQRFIIVDRCKKTYECLSINDLKKSIYNLVLLRKTDVKLSENKSIKGIKWLEEHPEFDLKNISGDIIDKILKVQKEFISQKKQVEFNNIIIKGEEYIITEQIGSMIGCISIYDKNTTQRQLKYFNLNDIDIVYNDTQKHKCL